VIVISDPSATKRIIDTARRLNPGIHIIARTRFVSEIDPLHELGADEVIPEDYEASVEVLSRVLKNYLVPIDDIENLLEKIRSDSFRMLRQKDFPKTPYFGLQLAESEISSRRVHAGSEAENRSLLELDLRNRYGVNVIAVRRNGNLIENPVGQEVLQADDILILLGRPEKLSEVNRIL
jgi:CPA2 family monovalent cation:H+ antiporter-2